MSNNIVGVVYETQIIMRNNDGQINSVEIGTLENQEVEVYNGQVWSKVKIKKTGENQQIVKIGFDTNRSIECTINHKFCIDIHGVPTILSASEIRSGMKTIKWSNGFKYGINFVSLGLLTGIHAIKRISDVYFFEEPYVHMSIFNGILTMTE